MWHRLSVLAVTLVFGLAVMALQEGPKPKDIPPFPGDGNSQHDGQPMHCQSHDGGGWAKNCACRAMEAHHCDPLNPDADDEPDVPTGRDSASCKVYCRKDHCHCASPCGG